MVPVLYTEKSVALGYNQWKWPEITVQIVLCTVSNSGWHTNHSTEAKWSQVYRVQQHGRKQLKVQRAFPLHLQAFLASEQIELNLKFTVQLFFFPLNCYQIKKIQNVQITFLVL